MRKIITLAIYILIAFQTVFALEESQNIEAEKVLCSKLVYNEVLEKAKEHSYNLQLADFDTLIAKQEIRGARSEYFPKLFLGASTEYNKNFIDNMATPSTYIGDTYINPYTRYQSLLGITLSYNIFDFGVKRSTLDLTKEDEELKKLIKEQELQELNLNITDTYTKIYILKQELDKTEKILEISKKNLEMKERLFVAQELSKLDLNEQRVEIEKTNRKLNDLKTALSESLFTLGFYTNEEYDIENLTIEKIEKASIDPFEFTDYTKSLAWSVYSSVIKKKEFELKIAKKTNLPKVNLYSRYYLYGTNKTNYPKTFDDMEPSNYSIGATLNMPIFDGMKNNAMIKKAKLELEKALIEREKNVAQLKNRLSILRANLGYLENQTKNNQTIINELTEKEKSYSKLLAQKIVSPIETNQTKIDLLQEEFEFEKNNATTVAVLKGIEILTKYDKEQNGRK